MKAFIEQMHETEVKPYLETGISMLLPYLLGAEQKKGVRYQTLLAISAFITAAERLIMPHRDNLLKILYDIIISDQDQELKGAALLCAGNLAQACGKENFPQDALEAFTKFGLQCIQSAEQKYELKSTAIGYFSEICKILKSQLAPIFEIILNSTIQACESEAGLKLIEAEKDEGFSLDSDSDEGDIAGVDIDPDFLDEKSAAVHALGNLALHCSGLMHPHLERVCKVLSDLSSYYHENIRYHVALTLTQISFGLLRLQTGKQDSDDKFEWEKGLPAKTALPEQVLQFNRMVLFPQF